MLRLSWPNHSIIAPVAHGIRFRIVGNLITREGGAVDVHHAEVFPAEFPLGTYGRLESLLLPVIDNLSDVVLVHGADPVKE